MNLHDTDLIVSILTIMSTIIIVTILTLKLGRSNKAKTKIYPINGWAGFRK